MELEMASKLERVILRPRWKRRWPANLTNLNRLANTYGQKPRNTGQDRAGDGVQT
jgi:hypothetical protein